MRVCLSHLLASGGFESERRTLLRLTWMLRLVSDFHLVHSFVKFVKVSLVKRHLSSGMFCSNVTPDDDDDNQETCSSPCHSTSQCSAANPRPLSRASPTVVVTGIEAISIDTVPRLERQNQSSQPSSISYSGLSSTSMHRRDISFQVTIRH